MKTKFYELRCTHGRYYLRCLTGETPRGRRIRKADADYLRSLSTRPKPHTNLSAFDMACVHDFGIGVYAP